MDEISSEVGDFLKSLWDKVETRCQLPDSSSLEERNHASGTSNISSSSTYSGTLEERNHVPDTSNVSSSSTYSGTLEERNHAPGTSNVSSSSTSSGTLEERNNAPSASYVSSSSSSRTTPEERNNVPSTSNDMADCGNIEVKQEVDYIEDAHQSLNSPIDVNGTNYDDFIPSYGRWHIYN